jgi:hypothetical protein
LESALIIEFDIRPGDLAVVDAWRAEKYARILQPAYGPAVFGGTAIAMIVWYVAPDVLGLGKLTFSVVVGAPVVVLGVLAVAFRYVQEHRYRAAPGFVAGRHSLHFSPAGVHHSGPLGVERFAWSEFSGVYVGARYLFVRFGNRGSMMIPVTAIEHFGPTYDEAFLRELVPLIRQGLAKEP